MRVPCLLSLLLLLLLAVSSRSTTAETTTTNNNHANNKSNVPDMGNGTSDTAVTIMEGVTVCEEHFNDSESFHDIVHFCVNYAHCKTNFHETPDEPCHCPEGLTGKHCEFVKEEEPVCNLDCSGHGRCVHGLENLASVTEWRESPGVTFPRCECNVGFAGVACQAHSQEVGVQCGQYRCFNGGKCVQQPLAGSNTLFSYYCDCTSARDATNSYGGRFCQSESTSFCTSEPDHNGHQFCVNGGTCREASHLGCDCPEGYIGPICEFTEVEVDHANCNLSCENNGVCRKGAKDTSRIEKFHFNRSLDEKYNEDFEHCVCPKGYAGIRCEIEMDVCPGVSHVCLNGAECQGTNDGTNFKFGCNCRDADTEDTMYAGRYCEYESTELCTIDGGMPQAPAFCVNNGLCKGFIDQGAFHPGCRCEAGYEGDHCEFVKDVVEEPESPTVVEDNQVSSFLVIGLAAGVGFFAILALFLCIRQRKEKQFSTDSFLANYAKPAAPRPTFDSIQKFQESQDGSQGDLALYEEHFSDESDHGDQSEQNSPAAKSEKESSRQMVRFDDRVETNLIV